MSSSNKATKEATKTVFIQKEKKPPDLPDSTGLKSGELGTVIPYSIGLGERLIEEGRSNENPLKKKGKNPISWAGLFNQARKEEEWMNSTVLKEKIEKIQASAKGKVFISDEDLLKARYDSKFILYGKFFWRTPPLELVKNVMPKLWELADTCQVTDLAGGSFAFKFSINADYWKAFTGGPWVLREQAVSLIPWKNDFQPLKEIISMIPVWIQLPGLPYEYMHKEILPQLAAVIGNPLKIDEFTSSGERGKFARICVLLDITKPVQQGLWIESSEGKFFQSVAYENLLNLCFCCGKVGHKENSCRTVNEGTRQEMKNSEANIQTKENEKTDKSKQKAQGMRCKNMLISYLETEELKERLNALGFIDVDDHAYGSILAMEEDRINRGEG
ncbi:hypothetical protein Cni_G02725 [Canna indica]|uniref:CCHC-type domain-containing protein n=1 Tax=Canna indica TaxID=4628 RepID=A0AAQ3JPV8_9LILI|nr:hypothetical protein Cni_G02725 [Canna indica]